MGTARNVLWYLLFPLRLFGLGSDAYTLWSHREQIVTVVSALAGLVALSVYAIAQRYPPWVVPLFALLAFLVVLVVVGWGVKGVRYLSERRGASEPPTPQPETTGEPETQEQRPTQGAPNSPLPEPPLTSSDEPFSLEPVKQHGPRKPNGERDIYMRIRVINKGSGEIRGCRGRLVKVQDLVSIPDGSEWRDIPHIHPAYLRWSPGDGGGDSADFTTEATLDVAVIESWTEPVYQLLTANESLRPTYQLEYRMAGPILTIAILEQSEGRTEKIFNLDGHIRAFLETPSEVEPVVRWRTWPP